MGRPLDPKRQTRFPPSGPSDERSHMADLRELEDAILLLQEQVAELKKQLESVSG